ncbi:MAG: tRNA (adenosine(37)-N6)-dimethylallyltransferase MiaA [Anaerovoracaceae bacterium]|jgi:tRNA dimethylallyltransferase|nr:tRNA (adenosine(37)-N6)-dimethylallyltransferase MiaA [Anaerovoracaceae bacterium]
MRRIIVLLGPTAVGKTKLAIELALGLNGEVVSADSMQLYKKMSIGSAKPTAEEIDLVPHHLVDQIDPFQHFTVAQYQKLAKQAIGDILSRGKVPIIAGGTGLYINSLIYNMDFGENPRDLGFRQEMEALAEVEGNEAVHRLLAEKDPLAAQRIHPNNLKKVIRGLERVSQEGNIKSFEESFQPTEDYQVTLIGLKRDREELYKRINDRVDHFIEQGLIEEVKGLIEDGLNVDNISMLGIGYKEIYDYIQGTTSLERAITLVKQNSRHLAKRQMTWFTRYQGVKWFDLSSLQKPEEEILKWLKNN